MICIRRHSKTADLGVYSSTARLRHLKFFHDKHGTAFAKDHSGPVLRERATSVRCYDTHWFPRFQITEGDRRLAAPGDSGVKCPLTYQPKCLSKCVVGGRARRRCCEGRTRETKLH